MQPGESSCYEIIEKSRVQQGDIIRNLNITFYSQINEVEFEHQPSFSYGIVLSQECDLEQHYKQIEENIQTEDSLQKHDKIVDVVLICPAFASERLHA